jgi:integrase
VPNEITPVEPPGELSTELRELADSARQYAEEARSENTRLTYQAAWKLFSQWCEQHSLAPMPASPQTIVLYFSWLHGQHRALNTLSVYRAAIARAHRMANVDPLPTDHAVVREVWQGIRRRTARLGPLPRPRQELALPALKQLLLGIPDGLRGTRDRAMLSIGFFAALRPSELAALRAENVREREEGLELLIPVSKGDQEGEGQLVGCSRQTEAAICPVLLLRAWVAGSGVKTGPLFRPLSPAGQVLERELARPAVADLVKRHARRVGLDESLLAGHSLRSGLATTASRSGKRIEAIQHQLRHKSLAVVHKYIRRESIWEGNASEGLVR